MNILHVIETLGRGGAENVLTTLLPEFIRNGDTVSVVVLKPPLDLKPSLEAEGIQVFELGQHHKWNVFKAIKKLAALSQHLNADIIHAHLYFPGIYVGLAKIFRQIKQPTFITFHNLAYSPLANAQGLKTTIRKLINRFVCRSGFDGKVAVSQAVAAHYQSHLRLRGIEIIHNPIDLGKIKPAYGGRTTKRSNNTDKTIRLLLPGRLVREKGHRIIIEAMRKLGTSSETYALIFAGDGPLRPEIETSLENFDLRKMTRITGSLTHQHMLEEMCAADIVIIPSLSEGFGLTAAEAMALAKPVIASDAGGLPELITHNETGLIVKSGDAVSLAKAISILSNDLVLGEKVAQAGRQFVKEKLSAKTLAMALRTKYSAAL